MKKLITLAAALIVGVAAQAQSISMMSGNEEVLNFSPADVDAIVFNTNDPTGTLSTKRYVDGTWCSVGTSITWYNDNVSAATNVGQDGKRPGFKRGYQDRVMDKIEFGEHINAGHNGGSVKEGANAGFPLVKRADYYTIEHGVNDWGKSTTPGTIDDYINNTKNGTFAACYRQLIDKIYSLNPHARIVLCTPRKAYGFNGFNPDHWYDAKKGFYLKEYADLVRQIAEYESLPVADFFNECGGQANLAKLSIDVALHPNDAGYQLMANVLIKAFEKIIVD